MDGVPMPCARTIQPIGAFRSVRVRLMPGSNLAIINTFELTRHPGVNSPILNMKRYSPVGRGHGQISRGRVPGRRARSCLLRRRSRVATAQRAIQMQALAAPACDARPHVGAGRRGASNGARRPVYPTAQNKTTMSTRLRGFPSSLPVRDASVSPCAPTTLLLTTTRSTSFRTRNLTP